MFSKTRIFAASLVAGAAVVAGSFLTAQAEEGKGPNHDAENKAKMNPKAQAMADYSTACELADYGHRNNDPMALVAAARILKAVTTTAMEGKPEEKKTGDGGQDKKDASKTAPVSADACLDAAAKMAGEDEALQSLIAAVRAEKARGAVTGPARGEYVLNGRCYQDFVVSFVGGERAEVAVDGDDDTDLDLFIYDQNGNLIISDTRAGDFGGVYWTPRWTGPFTIRVVNLGTVWNHYVIAHN